MWRVSKICPDGFCGLISRKKTAGNSLKFQHFSKWRFRFSPGQSWWRWEADGELARCGTSGMFFKIAFSWRNPRMMIPIHTNLSHIETSGAGKNWFCPKMWYPKMGCWKTSFTNWKNVYPHFQTEPNWTNTANQPINNPHGKWDHWDHFGSLLMIEFPKMNPMKFWWFNQIFFTILHILWFLMVIWQCVKTLYPWWTSK